ncbi:MAG TPA: signal peptidase I [Patescibacteria group bacterium]|nr:signal peptidase I [Patescibacteria group bacterium]
MFKRLGTFFLDILEVIVFAVGIFFFVYLLIMRPHKIKGQSMMPNFPDKEFLLTEKVSYYLHDPQRGDVVVFIPPTASASINLISCGSTSETPTNVQISDEFIKRVIALPGETVMIKDGHVYVNEKILNESYIPYSSKTTDGTFLCEGQEYRVPEGMYFVMGDNRNNSSDSRYWGPITKKEMTGRSWVIYWPINLAGSVKKPNY